MSRSFVPDNMSAIIKDPDALNPTLVDAFLDYAQARGISADPARVRSPKDKPRVENQVPYVRESWFDGGRFVDLDDTRGAAPSTGAERSPAHECTARRGAFPWRGLRDDRETGDARCS